MNVRTEAPDSVWNTGLYPRPTAENPAGDGPGCQTEIDLLTMDQIDKGRYPLAKKTRQGKNVGEAIGFEFSQASLAPSPRKGPYAVRTQPRPGSVHLRSENDDPAFLFPEGV